MSATPQQLAVQLQGVTKASEATLQVMAGQLTDINTLADPMKIAPKTLKLKVAPNFTHEFPAHSVNVLRVKTK